MPRPLSFNNTPLTDAELNSRTVDVIGDLDTLNKIYFPNSDLVAAINAVPGMMERTFYVDPINGSDNNDGSQNAPFQSLTKAVDSIPVGGVGTIYLKEGQTFTLTENIVIRNKKISFYRWGNTAGVSNPIITSTEYVLGSYDAIYTFILKDGASVAFGAYTIAVDIVIPNHTGTNSIHPSNRSLILLETARNAFSAITFHFGKIVLNKHFGLIDVYNYNSGSPGFMTHFTSMTIEANDANTYLISLQPNTPMIFGTVGSTIVDNTNTGKTFRSLVNGIVTDGTTGQVLNVLGVIP